MHVTIEDGRILPEIVLEFLGMGKGPDLPALLCRDTFGRHVTLIGFDEDYYHLLISTWDDAVGTPIPVEKFPISVMGWPRDWTADHSLRETIRIDPRGLPPVEEFEDAARDGHVGGNPIDATDRDLFARVAGILRAERH